MLPILSLVKAPAFVVEQAVVRLAFVIPGLGAAVASAANKPAVLERGTALPADPVFAAKRTVAGVFAVDIAELAAVLVGLPAGYLAH